MMTRAAKLGDAVSFSVGEPDFFPSQEVIDATQRAADEGYVKYSPGAGFAELRQAAYAEYLSGADLVSYSAEEVIVTAGGMDGGVVVEQGKPAEVFDHPQYPRTQQFLRAVTKKDGLAS